jgi:putative oxidoreductase
MLEEKLKWPLFILRLGVFIVMFIWTLDKFVRPEHTSIVFQKFYMMPALSMEISYLIGTLQALIILGFILGVKKKLTYGTVLFLHGISTLSSYSQYFNPWEGGNILFFAAWPMLGSIIALYMLRNYDTLFTFR